MKNRNLTFFLIASAILGVTQSIDSSFFNNFLNDTFRITVEQRTWLEIPREFPGFLVVFATGLLVFLADIRIAAIANIVAAVGMVGIGFLSKGYGTVVIWLTVYSMGQHLFMPMANSIGMSLGKDADAGKRLGQIGGATTAVFLATSLITAVIAKNVQVNYHIAFLISAIAFVAASTMMLMMKTHKSEKVNKKRIVIRKEYKLYYLLSIVYGARKQIFITFGPWVLIKIFNQGVSTFALLGFVTAGLGILVKPLIGTWIDKAGEKFVLSMEAVLLILVCAVYGLSKTIFESIGLASIALFFICGSFVLDQMLAATSIARATYLKKIALTPEDVSPTLSMGISIDHIVSMFIPVVGGLVWKYAGYEYVFLGGALIAVLNLFLVNKINIGTDNKTESGMQVQNQA